MIIDSTSARPVRVFTVPPGTPFLKALAGAILAGGFPAPEVSVPDAFALARWTILLPTRRAQRALAEAFLEVGGKTARLLPRIRAIGDVDEEELFWAAGGEAGDSPDIPPAITPMRRLFLLASLIEEWARASPARGYARSLVPSPLQAFALARSLARLIDSFATEDVPLDAVATLVEGELAVHHELALGLLDIVRTKLPEAMGRLGFVSAAERRNLLLTQEAKRHAQGMGQAPIIAAGSTGSIPATARLLATIARLDLGAVVLPGLDRDLDEDGWTSLSPQHPQFGMAELLKRIGVDRSEVRLLPGADADKGAPARTWIASEIMRPADTTERWHEALIGAPERLKAAVAGITTIAAPAQREEAAAIALIMRRTLSDPGRTAALVTADRRLARRVKAELKRWSIDIDDSAGEPLLRTPHGSFLMLIVAAAASGFAAKELAALLNHPFCRFGRDRRWVATAARVLELSVLRGPRPVRGLVALVEAARSARLSGEERYVHPAVARIDEGGFAAAAELADLVASTLGPLEQVFASLGEIPLDLCATTHIAAAEQASAEETGAPLWRGEAGEALSGLLAELLEDAGAFPPLKAGDYPHLMASLLAAVPVRPQYGRHPRLSILGLLEARLVSADVTILGGLNEGVWPPEAETDPWLNRPQRKSLGLPLPERRLGLTAHDFAQGLGAPEVYLTWSRKIGAQPAVASRWVLRLQALLKAAKMDGALDGPDPWIGWVLGLDHPQSIAPVARPAVRPPVEARPRRLSVTRIDELISDPYATFARHILKLRPLDALGAEFGPQQRGLLMHAALQRFASGYPGALPPNAADLLLEHAEEVMDDMGVERERRAFYWPRVKRIALWFVTLEQELRTDAATQHMEVEGAIEFPVGGEPFTLTARADRIDVLGNGSLRIIDYKTGALPSFDETAKSFSPQLLLEAHLAMAGGFKGLPPAAASDLTYVQLSGGEPAGKCKSADKLDRRIAKAAEGVRRLLDAYADPATPYEAADWSEEQDGGGDFGHLSRWREWAIRFEEEAGA